MGNGCDRYLELMHERLDLTITRSDGVLLEDHLERCATCRSTLRALESSVAILAAMPAPDPGPAFVATVVARAMEARRRRARTTRTFTWLSAGLVAAAASIAIGLWAGIVEPTIPGLVLGVPRMGYAIWATLSAIGDTLGLLVHVLAPMGNAAVLVAVDVAFALVPLYLVALACIALIPLLSLARRPLTTLPVLSI